MGPRPHSSAALAARTEAKRQSGATAVDTGTLSRIEDALQRRAPAELRQSPQGSLNRQPPHEGLAMLSDQQTAALLMSVCRSVVCRSRPRHEGVCWRHRVEDALPPWVALCWLGVLRGRSQVGASQLHAFSRAQRPCESARSKVLRRETFQRRAPGRVAKKGAQAEKTEQAPHQTNFINTQCNYT